MVGHTTPFSVSTPATLHFGPKAAEVHIVVEYDGQQLQIVTTERTSITFGDPVTVAVPEAAIHVFDRDSGARLTADNHQRPT